MSYRAFGGDPAGVTGLGKVVIVSRYPENRNDWPLPLPLEYSGQPSSRKSLVDGIQGTSEQSRLLARGHYQCTGLPQASQHRIAGGTGHEGLGQSRIEGPFSGGG